MKLIHVLLVFALVLFTNVSHGFDFGFGKKAKTIPQWVESPKADDSEYIYGVGEGDSLAVAVQTALNNISGKLATVVSSNISSETTQNQGSVSGYFSEQVKTKTFDTKLSGYEVVKSEAQDDRFYALVKMSRSTFVKDTMTRLKTIDDRINSRVALASKVSKLQQYLALNEIKPDMVDASALVLLLQAASPSFDSTKYLSVYAKHQTAANEMLYQMNFRIEADASTAAVADIIVELLSSEKLSAVIANSGRADAVISLKGSAQKKFLFNEYSTSLKVKIQVTDETGRKVNTEEHVVAGASPSSYESSMVTASNMLGDKLREKGAFALLGFQKPQ
jgi:hypothetical protein